MTKQPQPPAPPATEPFDPSSATVVVVTYDRSALLARLLDSLLAMDPLPGRVVVVDNASTDDTPRVLDAYAARFAEALPGGLVVHRSPVNTGGAGGFSEGVRVAWELGATWLWLMDDDVEVVPGALGRLGRWAERFRSVQPRRYDFDGSEFYWQYRQSTALGIPIPFAPAGFDASGFRDMNSGCFEGMLVHRDVVAEIGLPDPRFFIYWDDAVYGWLASRVTRSVIVDEFALRRTREIRQWDMGVRHLNASSDRYRYYILRNRGIMRHYYRAHGALKPVRFALGTLLTIAKELVRLVVVERTVRGTSNLWRGLRDGRRIARDRSFATMPPLAPAPAQPSGRLR
ncbi:glycosyltransferase [Kineococcus sp. SYSU DK004]|uniref:glycosyltransferase n=1 Tax=Kineococcus sp. SYSU DK004 TaxID=3383125 RepID=UPI003D7DA0E7